MENHYSWKVVCGADTTVCSGKALHGPICTWPLIISLVLRHCLLAIIDCPGLAFVDDLDSHGLIRRSVVI